MGACLRFCGHPSEQSPGIHSTADNLGAQQSSRLCACRGILCYPRSRLGMAFSCRPAEAVARRVDRVPPARRTVPPAAAAAAEERGGNRLAQGNYFGGRLVERIAEATPASHLTQGRSNEDIPVKQCGCFKQQSNTFFSHQLGHALAHSCKCRCKEFERNPCQIRLGHLHPADQNFSGTPVRARYPGGVNGGT